MTAGMKGSGRLEAPRIYQYSIARNSEVLPYPYDFADKPMRLVINGATASGGENLANFYRALGLDRILGTRTSGAGLSFLTVDPIDNGQLTAPYTGIFRGGKWLIEGAGVSPDREVLDEPVRRPRVGILSCSPL